MQCRSTPIANALEILQSCTKPYIEGILPKGPYPPCLRMADRALLAGYPIYIPYIHTYIYIYVFIHPIKHSPIVIKHTEGETNWPPFCKRHFKFIFLTENCCALIRMSLKCVHGHPVNDPALDSIMVWRRTGDKPLPQPVIAMCASRPQ